jgi:hypothetical protein
LNDDPVSGGVIGLFGSTILWPLGIGTVVEQLVAAAGASEQRPPVEQS